MFFDLLKASFFRLVVSAALFAISFPVPAHAQPKELTKFSQSGFELSLEESTTANFNLIAKSADIKLINAFLVENPNRLVIDVTTSRLKQNKNLSIAGAKYLSGVRLGVHADKVRIVVDIPGQTVPSFVSENPTGLVKVNLRFQTDSAPQLEAAPALPTTVPLIEPTIIALSTATSAPTSVPPTKEPTVAPPTRTATPSVTHSATPSAKPQPTTAASPTAAAPTATPLALTPSPASPTVEPETIEPEVVQPAGTALSVVTDPAKQELAGIFFEHSGAEQSPVLRLSLSRRGEFRFSKADEKSYLLILPGYSLGSNQLALPQFPPQDFDGMTFLKAINKDGGVEVTIGIERGTRLAPISMDNDILVRIGG